MPYFQPILINLAIQLPILLALLIGIIIAIVTWKRNPKPSLLALIAFLILGILTILGEVTKFLYPMLIDTGMKGSQITAIIRAVIIILAIIRAGAYGLLIGAVFSKRKKPAEVAKEE